MREYINNILSRLKPATRFDNTISFNDYYKAPKKTFDTFVSNVARPEFEDFTYNPFVNQQENIASGGYGHLAGNRASSINLPRKQINKSFYDQVEESMRNYENTYRGLYDRQRANYYNSPIRFMEEKPKKRGSKTISSLENYHNQLIKDGKI